MRRMNTMLHVTTCLYLCVSSCTMDHGCEAYEYNTVDKGTCQLLNGTSSAAKTFLSTNETQLYVKGKIVCKR